ncbi:hypothetical protein JKP88DRAFT_346420 [Tribonema minus]|uniref:Uncharacterized protein n=1 Tax=Tribonema minus TaxID=303371 RepID=A0A836CPQ4_9STRA|nr:hypothetical protein JKP88DRAFT_346420 [Tribonema minus]
MISRCCVLALLFVGGAAAYSLRGLQEKEQHGRNLAPKLCLKEWKKCKADVVCNNCLENGNVPEKPQLKGASCNTVDKWWAQIDFTGLANCDDYEIGKSKLSLLLYCRYDSYSAEAKLKCEVDESAAPSMVPTTMPFMYATDAPAGATDAPTAGPTVEVTAQETLAEGPCGICGAGCGCKPGIDGCQCGPEFPGYKPPAAGGAAAGASSTSAAP